MNDYEKIQDQFRVKVIKREQDTRTSIAGSLFINPGHPEHDGTTVEANGRNELASYAVIPAGIVEQVMANNKQYIFSEPYIPQSGEDSKGGPEKSGEETKGEHKCPHCDYVAKAPIGLVSHIRSQHGDIAKDK